MCLVVFATWIGLLGIEKSMGGKNLFNAWRKVCLPSHRLEAICIKSGIGRIDHTSGEHRKVRKTHQIVLYEEKIVREDTFFFKRLEGAPSVTSNDATLSLRFLEGAKVFSNHHVNQAIAWSHIHSMLIHCFMLHSIISH